MEPTWRDRHRLGIIGGGSITYESSQPIFVEKERDPVQCIISNTGIFKSVVKWDLLEK